jgi:hypothetical protein
VNWQAVTLCEADNVAIVLRPVRAGEVVGVAVGGRTLEVTALEPVALCHKIALADLAPGDPVVKYGECIGEAVLAIRRGSWVHTHNLRSRRAQHKTSP